MRLRLQLYILTDATDFDTLAALHDDSDDGFPMLGINLTGIHDFIRQCGGMEAVKDMSCTQVKDIYVMKVTETTLASYCHHVVQEHRDGNESNGLSVVLNLGETPVATNNHCPVGKANVFVSFAFLDNFCSVISCLPDEGDSTYFWLSIFSTNQHLASERKFDWWSNTFLQSIEKINRVIMVALPWNNPTTLTRSWCLWELYCAIKSNSKFEIALGTEQESQFFEDILAHGTTNSMYKMMATIDCENSKSFKPKDKEDIDSHVRALPGGFSAVNGMILEKLREWVIEVTKIRCEGLQLEDSTDEKLQLMFSLGELYSLQGKYDMAEEWYKQCLQLRMFLYEEGDIRTLSSMHGLAYTYHRQRQYEDAEKLYQQCLLARTKVLGVDHRSTIKTMNNMANLYENKGLLKGAEDIYIHCIELLKNNSSIGESDSDTLGCMNNLAALYDKQGEHSKAKELYSSIYEMRVCRCN